MLALRPELVKGQASQRLYFDAADCGDPRGRGRPTSLPSVQIKDEYGGNVVSLAASNVTQESADTTIGVSAAAGADALTLTSAADVVARDVYRLDNHLGQHEWVRPKSVNATTGVIELDEPLEHNYAVDGGGGTFGALASTRFYYTLQAADVDALGEMFVAVAVYAFGGFTHQIRRPFDVVLHPLPNPLTVEALKRRWPDLPGQEFKETRGSDYADQRGEAWGNVLRAIRRKCTAARQWRPALVIDVSDLYEWGLAEFALLATESGVDIFRNVEALDAIETAERRVGQLKAEALATLHWLDLDEDESRDDGESQPVTADCVR